MEYLHSNLAALRPAQPELARRLETCAPRPSIELVASHSGGPSIRVDRRLEASAQDPEAEARALARHFLERASAAGAERLVVFGIGVHTLRFLEDFDGDILVVEPSTELCRRVFEHIDLSGVLGRIEFEIGNDVAAVLRHPVFSPTTRGVLVEHPAARSRAGEFFDRIASRFHPHGVSSKLDIVVVPPLYGGSLPVAKACASAFRSLGHRVREVDLSPFLPAYREILRASEDDRLSARGSRLIASLIRVIGETVLSDFEIDPPDLVFALAQAPLDEPTLERMGQLGVTRAFWFCEDFHVMSYWRDISRFYDTIFHVQPDDFSGPLREAGVHGFPLPMGFDPELHRPITPDPEAVDRYGCDLSFIGAGYHNRVQLLQSLFSQGLRIYGTEWPMTRPFQRVMPEPNQRQSSENSNLIFNCTRINLNLHSSPWCDGVNPAGDFLNPRTFELAGARAFQLVDVRRDLPNSFEPGVEVETFSDVNECRKKIRYYLEHEDERREMAEHAYTRALNEHTYRHRMELAIQALEAAPVPLVPRSRLLPTAGAISSHLGDDEVLGQVLQRLNPETVIDSHSIALAVSAGKGPLSREEKILLLMCELRSEVSVVENPPEEADQEVAA